MPHLKPTGLVLLLVVLAGCSKPAPVPVTQAPIAQHEHHPPHGGTSVVLGDESYHVEFVLDASSGRLQAYIFDGELENFIRSSVRSFEVAAQVNGETKSLTLRAVANPATGETVGDTSLFETQADWLKTTTTFDAKLKSLIIRGTTFSDVKFNFPAGNVRD